MKEKERKIERKKKEKRREGRKENKSSIITILISPRYFVKLVTQQNMTSS
jgi:hypothetical protein